MTEKTISGGDTQTISPSQLEPMAISMADLDESAVMTKDVQSKVKILEDESLPLELPRLPRVLEILSHHVPAGFEHALIMSMLPVLGALATGARFEYLHTSEIHSFSFISCLTGEAASGKSSIIRAAEKLLEVLYDEEEKTGCTRRIGEAISQSKLLLLMDEANGKHLIAVIDEIQSIMRSWKKLTPMMRKSFDNSVFTQHYMDRKTPDGSWPVFFNMLLAGTPMKCMRFFDAQEVENGLVERVNFVSLPDIMSPLPARIEPYTDDEEYELLGIALHLRDFSGELTCPAVDMAIEKWLWSKFQMYEATGRRAIESFRKRAAVIGYRAGMLCYLLEKDNASFTDSDITAFALYVAEFTLRHQLRKFESAYDAMHAADQKVENGAASIAAQKKPMTAPLLNLLQQEFSRDEYVKAYAITHGGSISSERYELSRMKANGLVEEIERGRYRKVAQI